MRMLFVFGMALTLCNLLATGQDAPNKLPPPKPQGFWVEVTIFNGHPKGSREKGTLKMSSPPPVNLQDNTTGYIAIGKDVPLGMGRVFHGSELKFSVEATDENCVELNLNTTHSESDKVGGDDVPPTVSKYKYKEKVQLGATIKVRMTPEDKYHEIWAEIKIEKAK